MKQLTLAAAVLVSLGLTACERPGPTVVTTPAPPPTVVTVAGATGATGTQGTQGEKGAVGATGTPGEPGKTNTDTVVVVPARP